MVRRAAARDLAGWPADVRALHHLAAMEMTPAPPDRERSSCARSDRGGTRGVAELVHGAREAVRGAQIGTDSRNDLQQNEPSNRRESRQTA